MRIRNIDHANQILAGYVPLQREITGKDITLERMQPLMTLLGNPQDALKIVHIAGTSGKTSTAYYTAAMLQGAGARVGLTVSPHIDSVTERVQVNGQPLGDDMFCQELGEFLDIIERAEKPPTYFELLVAFAYWEFARQQVDYAVIETGLGGLHDATNIAGREDKICVITDIGYDHVTILGDTLSAIAGQKAGIIHTRNAVFMHLQESTVMEVIERQVAQQHATLHLCAEVPLNTEELPLYQARNWELAKCVAEYVISRDGLSHLTRQVLLHSQAMSVPARMESTQVHNKHIIMDGAHNPQKIHTFVTSFKRQYPDTKPAVLLALRESKDYEQIVPHIADLAGRVIVTTFEPAQDLPIAALDPERLGAALRAAGARGVQVIPRQTEAYRALLDAPEDMAVITGSFYLISQLRATEHLV